jgi:hypothetical protein
MLQRIDHALMACFLLAFIGLSAGCDEQQASKQPPVSDVEVLKQRAAERWQALVSNDWQTAYELEAPAYRAVYDIGHFSRRFGTAVTWDRAEVMSADVGEGGDAAVVNVTLWYRSAGVAETSPPMPVKLRENWVKDSGLWWYLHKSNKMLQNTPRGE